MKKILLMLFLLLIPFTVNAFHIEGFYKDINISLDCDACEDKDTREIKLKLYANGEALDDTEVTLNKGNDFSTIFEDLPIFEDDGFTEINYEVRFFEDGQYRAFAKSEISYEKDTVSKWISIEPEDIKPGEKILLVTDNWNHEQNGGPDLIITSGDMHLYEINVIADYNIINGKKAYYSIDDSVSNADIWTVSAVKSDELLYEGFENYIHLSNSEGKNMSLTGFDKGTWIDYVFRQTSKPDGYNESENSWNTSKVEIVIAENEPSRFHISSHNVINDEVRGTRYLGVDHFMNITPQTEKDYAAHFIAFKYVENVEAEQVFKVHINREICKQLKDLRKIPITDNVDVLGVFKDIDDITGIDFNILDPTIVKIENGIIKPLKPGETDIKFRYGFTDYSLHIIVYDEKNPNTIVGGIASLIVLIGISGLVFVLLKNRKKALE